VYHPKVHKKISWKFSRLRPHYTAGRKLLPRSFR
jgi:hypothetical protein